jgi:hypothetical protein
MRIYLLTVLSILGLSLAWALLQKLSRAYSARHPEFGPHREEGQGCCGGCVSGCRQKDQA